MDWRVIVSFLSTKLLRKRWVLLLIFLLSLTYFIVSMYPQVIRISMITPETASSVRRTETFKWSPKFDKSNATLKTCRNSVQGRTLLADERGYVCERLNVLTGGCCDVQAKTTKHYTCDSCMDNNCCGIYEHCVSCCLQPDKQPLLRKILGRASDTFNNLFASVTDHFELCLAKCRTSSQSVQHENSYRDPNSKHCFGEDPPSLNPGRLKR